MKDYAEPLARLIDELKRLPGIGQKSAQRIAFHLERVSREDAERLAAAILDAKDKIRLCSTCNNLTELDPCEYCTDSRRDGEVICVVETPYNVITVERPANSGDNTTCCTEPFRPCKALGRTN